MQTLRNISDQILAAFIYFTRLPFYKIRQVPSWYYSTVVEHWPLTGWLTGSIMAVTLYLGSIVFPYWLAVILAIAARLLTTGAFHEDGLADFFDGFGGGGNDRTKILEIMKDSRTGTYGIIALVVYFMCLFLSLWSLPPLLAALTIFAADPFSKMVAAQIIQTMPYARKEEESKAKVIYRHISVSAGISLALQGLIPMIPLMLFNYGITGNKVPMLHPEIIVVVPCLVMFYLQTVMRRKINGYTGDCCGASFLMCELSFYMTIAVEFYNFPH